MPTEVILVNAKEAGRLVAVNPRTVRRWSDCGHFPAPVRPGPGERGPIRWRLSDIREWIAKDCEPDDMGGWE